MRAAAVCALFCLFTAGCYAGTDPEGDGGETATRLVNGEIVVLGSSLNGVADAGFGTFVSVSFTPQADAVAPSYEENPGSPFACKVYEKTPEQYAYAGVDEGTVQLTVAGGPEYPACNHVPGEGYRCISVSGSGGDIQAVGEAQYRISNSAVTFGADEVGRHVEISGAAAPENNGTLAIATADANTITYVNPQPGAGDEATTGAQYRIVAGLGPSGQPDPMVANDAALTVDFTAGGEGDFDTFSYTLADFADGFTLDTASQALLSSIPLDGSEFTVSCAGEGGDCGNGLGSGIQIFTTDAPIDESNAQPPFILPPPVARSVLVSCTFLSPQVTVPAEASAFIESSGATRILARFVRVNASAVPQAGGTIQVLGGQTAFGITQP